MADSIRRLDRLEEPQVLALADILIDCVEAGDGIGFLHPLGRGRAEAFWRGLGAAVESGDRALLIAEDAEGIVGTVQLVLAQPDNQQHRADLAKLLVHRRGRRRGLGSALVNAAEETARRSGKTLLVLDTNQGSDAERLYLRLGWIRVGTIPNYSMQPQGGLRDTTIFYKDLGARA